MATTKAVELAENIYWVGCGDQENGLTCNPYLIVDGDEAVLIDPGSVLDFDYVFNTVCSIVPLEKIKYVILHHQDPDFCSSVPLFEQRGAKFTIVTHWRTQTIVKYYGIQSEYYYISRNNFRLILNSGRTLAFIQTPYLHFPGAITTYDYKTKILFSSDLFGAFSTHWSLFAGKDYIEAMKSFHEHYMPSNEILRSAMEVFLGMDISMIAPQHGSIINQNIRNHILALRDLECGSLLKPLRRNLAQSGGYRLICSNVVKRYMSMFEPEEVLSALEGIEMTMDENYDITDYNYTGTLLWNLIFEKILARKGLQWLLIIEPYVKTMTKEYDIPMPQVFVSNLRRFEEEAIKLSKENKMLKEVNSRLESSLDEARDMLIRCPITGVYNFDFFRNYCKAEINGIISSGSEQNPGLIIISPDNLGRIRYSYGDNELDNTLKNLVYILSDLKDGSDLLFRLQGTQFACYLQHTTKDKVISFAESIRNEIAGSKKFIETITVSIGLTTLDEVREVKEMDPVTAFYDHAVKRMNHAKKSGKNMVFGEVPVDSDTVDAPEILIVDTDEVNIDVLSTFLQNLGYKTVMARDGEEALRITESRRIQMIVSEVMLPKMDGFLLRERLLAGSNTKNIPFLVISYLKDENSVQRATALGIEHYFKKPYMLSEFLGVVKIKIREDA